MFLPAIHWSLLLPHLLSAFRKTTDPEGSQHSLAQFYIW